MEEEARTRSARTTSKARGDVAQEKARENLGPPPEAPTLEARLRASAPSDPTPQVDDGKARAGCFPCQVRAYVCVGAQTARQYIFYISSVRGPA